MHALKGFVDPVPVYPIEAVSERSKWQVTLGRSTTQFVGRKAELSQLLTSAESVATGAGRVLIISGDPGVGKSRLVHEAQTFLQERGWKSFEAECSPIVGDAPFSLLKNIIISALSGASETEQASLKAELSPQQLDALHVIVEGAAPESCAVWAKLTGRARSRAIVDMACAVLIRCVYQGATLLLIEDVQWADEASTAAIRAIADLSKRHPLFLIATARAGEAPTRLEGMFDQHLSLAPLERRAGTAMLDQLLGPSPHLAPLKERVLAHTGGMPLFVEEVCRGLVEAGRLTGNWGSFELASAEEELGVPLTIQGVIASRIDRLSSREKRVLQVAAAIGPQVPNRLLQAISALEQSAYRKILNGLLAAGMLAWTPQARSEPSFPHEFVRQVAYDATLELERVKLHKDILAQLEKDAAAAPNDQELAALMVHHAVKAKEWSRAADIAAQLARRCFSQATFADAKRYFELAISSTDKLPPSPAREANAIDLRIEARMAYGNFGEVGRWLDLAREAEARAFASGDQMRRVPALAMRAAALNFCGTPVEAVEAGELAVREAAQSGHIGWLAYAEYGLGQAKFVAGDFAQAVNILETAYRRFRLEGASPPPGGGPAQAALLGCMMICLCRVALGEIDSAVEAQARADVIVAETPGPAAAIAAGFSRAVILLARDDLEAAERSAAASLKLASQHDVHLFIPVIATQHGIALLRLRRSEEARGAFQLARQEAEVLGHRSASLRSEWGLALCDAITPAKRVLALEQVYRCEQYARQSGYKPLELEALLIRAALMRSLGQDFTLLQKASEELVLRTGALGTQHDIARLLTRVLQ
nr:AAA family ATPase [Bradyrhizobium diazoefficiens]